MKPYIKIVVYSAAAIEGLFLLIFIANGTNQLASAFFLGVLVTMFAFSIIIKNANSLISWTRKASL